MSRDGNCTPPDERSCYFPPSESTPCRVQPCWGRIRVQISKQLVSQSQRQRRKEREKYHSPQSPFHPGVPRETQGACLFYEWKG